MENYARFACEPLFCALLIEGNTLQYEKDTKQNQKSPMETTLIAKESKQ